MRTSLCALLTVAAAFCLAAPAAAADKDAFNSSGLRKAVTLEGVREHQAALQTIATSTAAAASRAPRASTRRPTTSSASSRTPATR